MLESSTSLEEWVTRKEECLKASKTLERSYKAAGLAEFLKRATGFWKFYGEALLAKQAELTVAFLKLTTAFLQAYFILEI